MRLRERQKVEAAEVPTSYVYIYIFIQYAYNPVYCSLLLLDSMNIHGTMVLV